MARDVALAVDLGASGGRVVSGAFDGRILELEEIHRFENGPVLLGGQLVWDLPRLWQEVTAGLRAAALRHGGRRGCPTCKKPIENRPPDPGRTREGVVPCDLGVRGLIFR